MGKSKTTTITTKYNGKLIFVSIFFILCSFSMFSAQKLTTTAMRENSIRINALEINQIDIVNIEQPKEITIVLDARSLNFDFDKSVVKEEYYPVLENLIEFIKYYNYNVTIVGYTDSIGSDKYNLELSKRRAESVKAKLIELGLEGNRVLEVSGEGEANPIATNSTSEGRFKNRRVEFRLIQKENKDID